jgi:hypothetical protein
MMSFSYWQFASLTQSRLVACHVVAASASWLSYLRSGSVVASSHAHVSLPGHSVHDSSMIPGGMRQKVLQHLIVTIGNCFDHTLHVALVRLHQPVKILLGRVNDTVVSRLEIISKGLTATAPSTGSAMSRSASCTVI